jgi:hypothetical protein
MKTSTKFATIEFEAATICVIMAYFTNTMMEAGMSHSCEVDSIPNQIFDHFLFLFFDTTKASKKPNV